MLLVIFWFSTNQHQHYTTFTDRVWFWTKKENRNKLVSVSVFFCLFVRLKYFGGRPIISVHNPYSAWYGGRKCMSAEGGRERERERHVCWALQGKMNLPQWLTDWVTELSDHTIHGILSGHWRHIAGDNNKTNYHELCIEFSLSLSLSRSLFFSLSSSLVFEATEANTIPITTITTTTNFSVWHEFVAYKASLIEQSTLANSPWKVIFAYLRCFGWIIANVLVSLSLSLSLSLSSYNKCRLNTSMSHWPN